MACRLFEYENYFAGVYLCGKHLYINEYRYMIYTMENSLGNIVKGVCVWWKSFSGNILIAFF